MFRAGAGMRDPGSDKHPFCKTCLKVFMKKTFNYCPVCGKKIDTQVECE